MLRGVADVAVAFAVVRSGNRRSVITLTMFTSRHQSANHRELILPVICDDRALSETKRFVLNLKISRAAVFGATL